MSQTTKNISSPMMSVSVNRGELTSANASSMLNAPTDCGEIKTTEGEARIIVLSAVYTRYKSDDNPDLTEFHLPAKVNEPEFAERVKDVFMRVFGVGSVAQLEEEYGKSCTTNAMLVDTVERAHATISNKPFSFSPALFQEIQDLVFEAQNG